MGFWFGIHHEELEGSPWVFMKTDTISHNAHIHNTTLDNLHSGTKSKQVYGLFALSGVFLRKGGGW